MTDLFACPDCFQAPQWRDFTALATENLGDKNTGTCSFGHGKPGIAVKEVREQLDALFGMYSLQRSEDSERRTLFEVVQQDWSIFSLNSSQFSQVASACGVDTALPVGHTWDIDDGLTRDAATHWPLFATDIKHNSRFFPTYTVDEDLLSELIESRITTFREGGILFRARLDAHASFSPEHMYAPPPRLATAGRCNAAGISHLYTAKESLTCFGEIRAQRHESIAVGELVAQRELQIVDLAHIPFPDFFDEDKSARVRQFRYLKSFHEALRAPMVSGEAAIDYAPTQHLCDFIRSQGHDGLQFSSAMCKDGTNVILFRKSEQNRDDSVTAFGVKCVSVRHHIVADVTYSVPTLE